MGSLAPKANSEVTQTKEPQLFYFALFCSVLEMNPFTRIPKKKVVLQGDV